MERTPTAKEVVLATAVDTLLAGRLAEATGKIPLSRVRLVTSPNEIAQANRFTGYSSGGYKKSKSGYSGGEPL